MPTDRATGSTLKESFPVTRLTVRVPDVRGFQRTYEAAVPEVPKERISALLKGGAPWSEMVELVDASAPHGFLIYEAHDVHPLMQAAGDDADCLFYLMGNHIVAERMFWHDPRTMLYAPLRTVIFEDSTGAAWFSVDQPSTHFASLGISEVTQVGIELDRRLAALVQALDLEVPEPLLES